QSVFRMRVTAYENTSLLPTHVGQKLPIKRCSTLFLNFAETMILVDGRYFRNRCKLSSISSDNARVLRMYCRTFLPTFWTCLASCFVAYGSFCRSRFFPFFFISDFFLSKLIGSLFGD